MHNKDCPLRAKLGASHSEFNDLEHEVVKYHDTNTMVALSLMVVSGLLYGVATNTFLVEFLTALYA